MEASIFTEVLLPLALAFIMFGMGLSLTPQDFTRLWKTPKPIVVGLVGQILLLPPLAFALCLMFELSAPLAIGLMILAACPGGTTSNLISQVGKANLALSVSLTAISTLICVFSTPFLIQFSVEYFAKDNAPEFSIIGTAVGLFVITLVPVAIGILVRRFFEKKAIKVEVYFRQFSLAFMIAMIVALVIKEREILVSSFEQVFLVTLCLNIFSVLMGFAISKFFLLSFIDGITLAIEVGIQNATLAILIAISFLNSPEFAVSASAYGLLMYITPIILVVWSKTSRASMKTAKGGAS